MLCINLFPNHFGPISVYEGPPLFTLMAEKKQENKNVDSHKNHMSKTEYNYTVKLI